MAKWYKVDGTVIEVSPKDGKEFTCEEINRYVGGHFETIPSRDGGLLLVNDCGKLLHFDYNELATREIHPDFEDYLVGNVLLISKTEIS